jgi:hypothetical protein
MKKVRFFMIGPPIVTPNCFHLLSHRAQGFSHSFNANRDAWNGFHGTDDGIDLT